MQAKSFNKVFRRFHLLIVHANAMISNTASAERWKEREIRSAVQGVPAFGADCIDQFRAWQLSRIAESILLD
jgi:hypothetical protein